MTKEGEERMPIALKGEYAAAVVGAGVVAVSKFRSCAGVTRSPGLEAYKMKCTYSFNKLGKYDFVEILAPGCIMDKNIRSRQSACGAVQ